jgi:ABC-2 type transport system permease protein
MSSVRGDLRAFVAGAVRNLRTMVRYPFIFAGALMWPVILPGVFLLQAHGFLGGSASALTAFASRAGTRDVAGFLYVGGAVYNWVNGVLWGPGMAIRNEQEQGTLEQVFLTPVSRAAFLLGPSLAELLPTLWTFLVVGLVLRVGFGIAFGPLDALRVLAVVLVATPALMGVGALFSTVVLRFRDTGGAVQIARGVFQVLCGMTFPIAVLPGWARDVALTLPPTYVIADVRRVLLEGAALGALLPDLALLAAMGVVLCTAGALLFGYAERHARRQGTLGLY